MNIYVANLAPEVNEEMLQDLFEPYGEIEKIRLMVDFQTNFSKGYAFITMPDDESAKKAIKEKNGLLFKNRKIAVRKAGKDVEKEEIVKKETKKQEKKSEFDIFTDLPFKGIVKFFEESKGYGFILLKNQRELFFHQSALPENVENLESGQEVEFNIQYGKKGFTAVNIIVND